MAKKDNKNKSATSSTTSNDKTTDKNNGDGSQLEGFLDGQLSTLIGGVKEISGQAVKLATEKAWEQAVKIIKHTPEQMEMMGKAGSSLKDLREVAGLTVNELSEAIDVKNPDLIRAVEEGKAALPFEILLRLASLHARNDPIPFILRFATTYNPRIASLFKKLGIDKLTMEAERETRFLYIYRKQDTARALSDEGFEKVRAFTEQAFEMALHFVAEQEQIDIATNNDEETNRKKGDSEEEPKS